MAQTQVIIIYSPNQNRRRRVIIPDDDSQVAAYAKHIVSGESVLIGSISDYNSMGPDAMLMMYTGKAPSDDRCIVHDGVSVRAIVLGDPAIDIHPLGRLAIDKTSRAAVGLSVLNGVAIIPADKAVAEVKS